MLAGRFIPQPVNYLNNAKIIIQVIKIIIQVIKIKRVPSIFSVLTFVLNNIVNL